MKILENPMVIERPYRYVEPVKMFKPEPRCSCPCNKLILDGCYDWDGDYFYSSDCITNYLLQTKHIKVVG